ncbi:MAG: hypothetical protein GXN92_01630 [Candidatus Micrarchaeota archaeon]|nr:hypothetical protein [Candidatus Micrarchaeota archaeon]
MIQKHYSQGGLPYRVKVEGKGSQTFKPLEERFILRGDKLWAQYRFEVGGKRYQLQLEIDVSFLPPSYRKVELIKRHMFVALADKEGKALFYSQSGVENLNSYKGLSQDPRIETLGKKHILDFITGKERKEMEEFLKGPYKKQVITMEFSQDEVLCHSNMGKSISMWVKGDFILHLSFSLTPFVPEVKVKPVVVKEVGIERWLKLRPEYKLPPKPSLPLLYPLIWTGGVLLPSSPKQRSFKKPLPSIPLIKEALPTKVNIPVLKAFQHSTPSFLYSSPILQPSVIEKERNQPQKLLPEKRIFLAPRKKLSRVKEKARERREIPRAVEVENLSLINSSYSPSIDDIPVFQPLRAFPKSVLLRSKRKELALERVNREYESPSMKTEGKLFMEVIDYPSYESYWRVKEWKRNTEYLSQLWEEKHPLFRPLANQYARLAYPRTYHNPRNARWQPALSDRSLAPLKAFLGRFSRIWLLFHRALVYRILVFLAFLRGRGRGRAARKVPLRPLKEAWARLRYLLRLSQALYSRHLYAPLWV